MKKVNLNSIGRILIKKYQFVDLMYNTPLNVSIGYQAIVYKDYVKYKEFQAGINKLNEGRGKKNDPSIYTIFQVNLSNIKSAEWGISYPINYNDIELGANVMLYTAGSYKYNILDPKLIIEKIMGDKEELQNKDICEFLEDTIADVVRLHLAKETKLHNFLEIERGLADLSSAIKMDLMPKFNSYGLNLNEFNINGFTLKPEWVLDEYRLIMFDKKENDVKCNFKGLTPSTQS